MRHFWYGWARSLRAFRGGYGGLPRVLAGLVCWLPQGCPNIGHIKRFPWVCCKTSCRSIYNDLLLSIKSTRGRDNVYSPRGSWDGKNMAWRKITTLIVKFKLYIYLDTPLAWGGKSNIFFLLKRHIHHVNISSYRLVNRF